MGPVCYLSESVGESIEWVLNFIRQFESIVERVDLMGRETCEVFYNCFMCEMLMKHHYPM